MANRRFKVKAQFDNGLILPVSPGLGLVMGSDAAGNAAWAQGGAAYVQSRGQNLVTNGSGLLQSNYNFSSFTFDPVETHGGAGSFRKNVVQTAWLSDELIPVDPAKAYRLIGWAKAGDVGGANYNAANRQYFGLACYDIDGNTVTPVQSARHSGSTDTTLAVALNPGDTTITLANATGWSNAGTAATRRFVWWPYTNAKGYTYPDYTYSRNSSPSGTWAASGISGNVITLSVPWAGPALPAGTKVRNAQDAGTYKYIAAANVIVPNDWTRYEGIIQGAETTGAGAQTMFFAGTAYVKLLFLVNYHGAADNNIRWSDLSLSELSQRNLEPRLDWGAAGSLTLDTNLYRSAADHLKTDDALTVGPIASAGVGASSGIYLHPLGQVNVGRASSASAVLSSYQAADTQLRFFMAASGLMSWGSGAAVADTNLYRMSADVLATDDRFVISRPLAGDLAFTSRVVAVNRFHIYGDGVHAWADGAGAIDTNLYRSAANILKTDDALQAASYAVGTTPLASTHLSDSAALARLAAPALTGVATAETLRASAGVGTQHVAAATPTGGTSGDIKVGDGKIWINDAGTWKSAALA